MAPAALRLYRPPRAGISGTGKGVAGATDHYEHRWRVQSSEFHGYGEVNDEGLPPFSRRCVHLKHKDTARSGQRCGSWMMEYGTRREKRWSGTQHLRGMVVQQSTNPPAQLGVCPPLQEGDADKLAALTEFFAQQGCGWSTRSRVDLAHAWRTTRRLCKGACAPNQAFRKRVDHVVLHIPVQYRYTYRFSMLDLPVLYRIPHEVCERTGLCCQLDRYAVLRCN